MIIMVHDGSDLEKTCLLLLTNPYPYRYRNRHLKTKIEREQDLIKRLMYLNYEWGEKLLFQLLLLAERQAMNIAAKVWRNAQTRL